jgi:hypothetical protein
MSDLKVTIRCFPESVLPFVAFRQGAKHYSISELKETVKSDVFGDLT